MATPPRNLSAGKNHGGATMIEGRIWEKINKQTDFEKKQILGLQETEKASTKLSTH